MSNKISGLNTSPTTLGTGRSAGRPGEAGAGASVAPAAASPGSDVQITGSAAQLSALMQALRSQPAVDEARVSLLRSAIEQGRYTVQPQHVADRLMQLEQALGPLPQG